MALTTRFGQRFRDMIDPFEDIFRTSLDTPMLRAAPEIARINVIEKADHYLVNCEIPGVNKQDIQVHLENNRLFIQANKSEEKTEENDRMHWQERSFGVYRRTLELPGSCNQTNVQAHYENGVLSVMVGKASSEKSGTLVPIQ